MVSRQLTVKYTHLSSAIGFWLLDYWTVILEKMSALKRFGVMFHSPHSLPFGGFSQKPKLPSQLFAQIHRGRKLNGQFDDNTQDVAKRLPF